MLCLTHQQKGVLKMTKEIIEQLESLENITLHFQERGQRINVRAYAGYNSTTKRSDYVLIGSLDKYTFEQNERLQSVLERSERIASAYDEALKKFKAVKAADDADTRRTAIKMSGEIRAESLAECLEARFEDGDDISAELASSVYAAIKRVESVLRKAGYNKTAKKE